MSKILMKSFFWPNRSRILIHRQITTSQIVRNKANAVENQNEGLKVGDVIHGYKLERLDHIKELNIKPYHLRHLTTGAEHLHIHKDGDSNNVFAVSLRTTPKNSTGVAHILEHLALCGSKKYAVRDPFFKMTTRSLATFMNAMTGADFTVYPFSTQNRKDFENMLNVYTDAVFFPRLRPVDFRQEGWRLEHETPDKKDTPIILKGVVYNEMKGVFSSSSAVYGRQILNNLFPDTTYKYESGGDPEHIPSLTHDELKKFHQIHYHPSNAKFFTYGDMPLQNHLKLINEMVLSKFSENSQARDQSVVQNQPRWDVPRHAEIACPPDPMTASPEKQTTTSISYLLPTNNVNYQEMFALQMISTLLIDGPNAPFYKNLIESGLGSDYSPFTGLATFTKQPYFSIGLQNIRKDDVAKVHKIINDTFEETAQKGFPSERIDAALHEIELSLKHIRKNFGLRLLMSLESVWNHEGDVIDYFRVNKFVEKFKSDLQSNPNYWRDIINEHFINNSHRLVMNMNPDERYEDRRREREQSLLEDKISKLNDIDKQTVLYEGMELKKIQDTKEDASILPCLDPSKDISRELSYRTELKFEEHNGVKIQLCEQPTNEVVYLRAITEVGDKIINTELVDYLPLFCDVATKLGAGKYSRHALAQRSQLTTGGLGVTMMINPSLTKFDEFKSEVCIGSHSLSKNFDNMLDLWANVYEQIHFAENEEYLFQLIKQSAAELSEGIPHSGQLYAIKRSAAGLSRISSLDERLSGLTFIEKMKHIASKEKISDTSAKLKAIANLAFDPFSMKCAINAETTTIQRTVDGLKQFIERIQNGRKSSSDQKGIPFASNLESPKIEDMKFPFATHYVSKALVTVPRMHEDFAKLVIMSKLISSKYLLREVREKGGAYGAGARVSDSGILNFYSYRDPNPTETLNIFGRSADWLVEGDGYNDRDVEESKLGVFQDVDRPVEPGMRGLNYFTTGETDDMRQEFRCKLLDVTQEDIVEVAEKYLNQDKSGTFVI